MNSRTAQELAGRAFRISPGTARYMRWGLLALVLLGALLLVMHLASSAPSTGPGARLLPALGAGCVAALATAAGTLPVLLGRRYSQRGFDCFLGLGAGVMLSATAFSLLLPALASAASAGHGRMGASVLVAAGMLCGVALIIGLERLVGTPTLPPESGQHDSVAQRRVARVWLFMLAVTLHNMPEGLAIGVAYAGIDLDKAGTLAIGIAIQDIPEGLVIALAFRGIGYGRWQAARLGIASGLIEPVAAVAGVGLVGMSAMLLPIGLAAAAGAMLFVIVNEVIPETQQHGNGKLASCALAAGFAAMLVLDTALG